MENELTTIGIVFTEFYYWVTVFDVFDPCRLLYVK